MFAFVAIGIASTAPCCAAEDETDLAKKTRNAVADLISVPLQNDLNSGVGPENDLQYILDIQPVIPIHLSESRAVGPPRIAW